MEIYNASEIRAAFNSAEVQLQAIQNNFMKELAADVLLEIFRLTNVGMNAYNKKFMSYSSSYIKQRQDAGKTTMPNAQYTSFMLNSIIIKKQLLNTFRIGPTGSATRGKKKKVTMANSLVLKLLQEQKNYIILAWTPHYLKLVEKHKQRYYQRWSNITF